MADERVVVYPSSKATIVLLCIGIGLIGLLLVAGFYGYKLLMAENQVLKSDVVEMKKLTDTLIRSSTTWVSKDDIDNKLKSLMTRGDLAALQEDLKKLDSRLTSVGLTVGSLARKVAQQERSDSVGPENTVVERCADGKLIDKYEYTKKPQIKLLTDTNVAPLAEVKFDAASDKPWSYEVYKRNFELITVVGKKESGQLTFHNSLSYKVPDKTGEKKYNIELLSSEFIQTPEAVRMFWLNPKLDVNVFVGGRVRQFSGGYGDYENVLSLGVDLGVSLSSYGKNKNDSIFRLFRMGVGYDVNRKAAQFSIAPLTFNAGYYLPFFSNLYLSPRLGFDTGNAISISLGLGFQL